MKRISLWLLVFLVWASDAGAQAPYYQGKTIRIVVGYPAGSAHDQWARLIAPQLTKYIPGNPNTVVQIMTGAGSMVAANYIYGVAKPDGLRLGVINAALYFEQLLGKKEVQFDWSRFAWIGTSTRTVSVLYMWADTPYKTIHDVRNGSSAAPSRSRSFSRASRSMPGVRRDWLASWFKPERSATHGCLTCRRSKS